MLSPFIFRCLRQKRAIGILGDERAAVRAVEDADERFVDCCEFPQRATGRTVTVVTAVTGMQIRTRNRESLRRYAIPRRYAIAEPKRPPGPCRITGLTPRPHSPEPRLGLVR
jgi:hypothetical protein